MSGIGGALSGLTGLAGSIFNYNQAMDAASQSQAYYNQMASATNAQTGISRTQSQLAQEQWDRYKSLYGPAEEATVAEYGRDMALYRPLKEQQVESALKDLQLYQPLKETMVHDAMDRMSRLHPVEEVLTSQALEGIRADVPAAMSRASADVKNSFAQEREASRRQTEGLGLDPAMTAYMDRLGGLEEAAAVASARTRAAEDEEDRAWEQTLALRNTALGLQSTPTTSYSGNLSTPSYGLSNNLSNQALNLYSSAASGLSGAANRYGSLASQMSTKAASGLNQSLGLFNSALGSLGL
jgi:hypothetical protein